MFCGWRLMNSFHDLERLGSGTLAIDAITGRCTFEGNEIPRLSIAGELNAWLKEDFERNHIPISDVASVNLYAVIALNIVPLGKANQPGIYLDRKGKAVKKGDFCKLVAKLCGEVKTDEATYRAERVHHESWPVGWHDTQTRPQPDSPAAVPRTD